MSVGRALALRLIQVFRLAISPLLPPSCRFAPTCSEYCYDAIAEHGVRRGGWLGVKRIARCHPFNPGGVDPVPELDTKKVATAGPPQQSWRAEGVGRIAEGAKSAAE